MNLKIPAPRQKLAGCVWLPRILAKAKLLAEGKLPPEYAERFCHPTGIDQQFLNHLELTREQVVALAKLSQNEAVEAFLAAIHQDLQRIDRWNQVAENLGRKGFPLEERFPVALATTYKHLAATRQSFSTVFEVIEADEGIEPKTT